ncbi:hypothetical protein [Rathayibacter agropyri]|uniref:hypothetical protein n=1 Tax=Rathayibacter agropyri TaxID=1634927 RepID=UPI001567A871|nr:hypothetical protein [Rathayibacter agropyri]NRD09143.1 hypothetical protein [Rathayibacter agropyri]
MTSEVWTTPVVSRITVAPTIASSSQSLLAFTQAEYRGTACTTIPRVQLRRLSDGCTPVQGALITVTLAGGYTFVTGSTTCSATTDARGLITLPCIVVPVMGGAGCITAWSDGMSVSARVCAPAPAPTAKQG